MDRTTSMNLINKILSNFHADIKLHARLPVNNQFAIMALQVHKHSERESRGDEINVRIC